MSFLCFIICIQAVSLKSQEPPERNRSGNSVSTVRNDSGAPMTIESRVNGQWAQLTIAQHADATIPGDHIRVATSRSDSAVVSVDLPVQSGKKYRMFWNANANIWDIAVSP
jgi:hypothetical protein